MKGLSAREVAIAAWLEFRQRYFFTGRDIARFTKTRTRQYNTIKSLVRKRRVVKLNRTKYYLVPIRAAGGRWSEHPFIIADEMCNGADYFIGGWSAASYWGLTGQVPLQTDVYTTRRQGKKKVLSAAVVFHRTSPQRLRRSVRRELHGHAFNVLSKEETKRWLESRHYGRTS